MGLCHAFDMRFVDYSLVVQGARRPVVCQSKNGLITTLVAVWPSGVDHRECCPGRQQVYVAEYSSACPKVKSPWNDFPIQVEQQLAGSRTDGRPPGRTARAHETRSAGRG